MSIKRDTLSQVPIFHLLGEKHLQEITKITKKKNYRKNEVIFHEGDLGNVLFVIKSGTVKISLNDPEGKETILNMLYENDFFGEMSLLDGQFRSATVSAIENTEALIIYRQDFVNIIKKNPDTVLEIVATLSRRLRKTNEKIGNLTFFDAYGKVAKVLLDLMELNGKKTGKKIILTAPVSRQEMAAMTGISRKTLNHILNEFQVRGCLEVDGRKITIHDENILRREVL